MRQKKPDNAVVVKANWRDNPWFPAVLDEERRLDLEIYPERYRHIWEGDYATAFEGAYFAKALELAKQEGRIGHVAVDPILPVKAFFDIGGAGHSSDAMAIWIAQFVGREIRLLDYIEGVGQPLAYYAHELRRRGWNDGDRLPTARWRGDEQHHREALHRPLDRSRFRVRHSYQEYRSRRRDDAHRSGAARFSAMLV